MQILLAQRMTQKICGYLITVMLVVALAGCGERSGEEDTDVVNPAPSTDTGDFVVARVGPILAIRVGETASLSEQNSYTLSTEPLSFSWSFVHKPDASDAELFNASSANPSFIADARGTYMVQLVASAEGVSSQRVIQQVMATIAPERPTGPWNHQGLSSNCGRCHNDGFVDIESKSQNHLATSNTCETCHTTLGFDPIPFTDHIEVFGNCSECHNNVLAIGKSEFHTSTNAECNECHGTDSFLELELDGGFDHSGITGTCSGCHNGTVAIGKTPGVDDIPPGTHPYTVTECGVCHTTVSFVNAYPDHTGPDVVGARCDSCHGSSAQGEPSGHPAMAVDCDTCHGIVTFSLGGVFNHRIDPAVLSCETCHTEPNSLNATGKTSTHTETTADCGLCHNTETFNSAFVDHTDLTDRCDSCHSLPVDTTLYAHMPITTEDCDVCHTPGIFSTGSYDHAGVVSGCATCHDDRISVGKLSNHFPTIPDSQDCIDCHSTTTFVGATFDHLGITGNDCASCHNGTYTTTSNSLYGKPGSHLPTTQDCSFCHATGVDFSPASNFSHVGITAQCETCHNGGSVYVEAGAVGKKDNHIPALNDCVDCHVDTSSGGFASTTIFLGTVHATTTHGCEGCHTSHIFPDLPLIKAADHLPVSQDCYVCHNINTFAAPTTMLAHTGITGNCISCHDGSFVGVGARAKTSSTSHPVTTEDCAVCHNTTNFADAFVDHNNPAVLAVRCDSCHGVTATGKDAISDHVATTQDCGTCHAAGASFSPAVFDHSRIVDNCASCHDGIIATGKDARTNPAHIPTSEDCSVCHVPTTFAQAYFDHQNIADNCGNCHDGTTVFGKHSSHVPTNEDCVGCHQTTGILPATFSHDGILDNCSSCHDAGFATPKDADHVETGEDCGVCHTPNAFIPATFDHTGIVDNCASCHGVTATPMPGDHLTTGLDCHFCHTTATFVGGTWVHDSGNAGNCDTCHNPSGGATSKPGYHLPTTEQCDVCHTTNAWAPANFNHSSSGDYPGDHRRDPGCTGCHGTIPDVDWGWSQYAPDCAACHAGDFESEGDHIGGRNGTVAQNRDCGRSGCHRVSDRDFD